MAAPPPSAGASWETMMDARKSNLNSLAVPPSAGASWETMMDARKSNLNSFRASDEKAKDGHQDLVSSSSAKYATLKLNNYKSDFGTNLRQIEAGQLSPVIRQDDFELVYAPPQSFVFISRTTFPRKNNEEAWKTSADENCPGTGETKKGNWIQFMKWLKASMGDSIRSKISLYHSCLLKEGKVLITYRGKKVETIEDLKNAWTKEPLTPDKCEAMFFFLYGNISEDDYVVIRRIQFEVMMEHGVWFSGENNPLNRKIKNGKTSVTTSSVWTLVRDKLRDSSARRLVGQKGKGPPHGVTITLVNPDRKHRGETGVFSFKDHVRGWGGEKHIQFNASFGTGVISDSAMPNSVHHQSNLQDENHPPNSEPFGVTFHTTVASTTGNNNLMEPTPNLQSNFPDENHPPNSETFGMTWMRTGDNNLMESQPNIFDEILKEVIQVLV